MKVIINDEVCEIADTSDLKQVLLQRGCAESRGVAVAVNEIVIPKKDWPVHKLNGGDSILIIQATQGG